MHASANGADLRTALATLKRITGRVLMPAAAFVEVKADRGGTITLRRTNAATEATANVATTGGIAAGSCIVDAGALADAIGKTKGTVTLTVTTGATESLQVRADGGTSAVPIPPNAADFPAPDTHDYGYHVADVLPDEVSRLTTVAKAAGDGDARAVLTAIAITANGDGTGEAVATDTYRMHVAKLARVSGRAGDPVLIPADVAAIAAKNGKRGAFFYLTADGKRYSAAFAAVAGTKNARRVTWYRVTGYSVEGPYPDYRKLIPDAGSAAATWTVADTAGTASVLAAFRNREHSAAVLTPSGSAVAVSATFRDGSKRDAIAPIVPDSDTIGLDAFVAFNPSYAADALTHAGDSATIRLRDSLRAAVIEGENAYALLMPMRVS